MEEFVEWFEIEFGELGFTLTPIMYDPHHFTPMKGVLYGGFLTNISIKPDIVQDIHNSWDTTVNPIQIYRDIVTEEIYRFLETQGFNPKNFIKKNIKKHKFI